MVAKVKKLRIISELTHFFEETTKVENKSKDPDIKIRNAGRGGGRLLGHGSPVFDRSVNPISTGGWVVDYAHHISTGPPSQIFGRCSVSENSYFPVVGLLMIKTNFVFTFFNVCLHF